MNAIQFDEEAIFYVARKLEDREARDAYLRQVCGGNASLRDRVDALLKVSEQEASFLEAAPYEATVDMPALAASLGTAIGPYKLVEQIGEGGMGLVYMAEQQRPLRRLVALKIIKPGMDSRQVIARFEAERQALAMMDHENIAKVFEAGTTEAGHPFFVMELVRGIPINDFCDQKRLTVRERLELFIPVCQAVQHAHQKGIIHRDLKPTNVLVTMHDVLAVPKVIDFGIAKALGPSLTEHTLHTGFAQLVGTPLYMSPKQAEMNQLGVDTRSDVYSLGVLLYELLTGTTPFDKETLGGSGLEEMRRIIREDEPPRPSARVSTLQAQAPSATSQRRSTDPRRISATLRGELDWIVMKALEKDRGRRYESASAFANDIQRYLCDEPVLACPPSTMYKFHKFARKHKAALATAVAIAASLILGTTASAWQAVRATTAEAQANTNERKAEANEAQAKEAAAAEAQQRQRAEANEQKANTQRDEAQRQRDEVKALNEKLLETQQELKRTLYTSNMNLAQRAWEEAAFPRVLQLLEQHRPKPGEPDLRGFEWHYLNRLCHADQILTLYQRLTLKGQPAIFDSVAFTPDGKRLMGVTLGGGGGPLVGVATTLDPELKVWDAQTGQELFSFTLKGAGRTFHSSIFSPDAKRLASTWHVDRTVRVWDTQTGQELFSFPGGGNVVFSPDGKRLASRFGRDVKVWDAQTGQELPNLKGHTDSVDSVAFSPDGKRLASSSSTWDDTKKADVAGQVKVWDAQTGQELLTLKGLTDGGCGVTFSPDSKRLVTTPWSTRDDSAPGEVKVWDAQTGEELFGLKGQGDGFGQFAFSPDGRHLVAAGGNSTTPRIHVWDAQTGRVLFIFQGHTSQVSGLTFSPDSKRLASGSGDRTLRIWDLQTGQEIRTLRGHTAQPRSLAFSPDGKRLATTGGMEVKVWDWDTQKNPESLTIKGVRVYGSFLGETPFAFSPDLRRLAGISDKTVKVWDTRDGQETLALEGHTNKVMCVAVSPDGKRLASGEGSRSSRSSRPEARPVPGVVKVWDAQTGEEILSLPGHACSVVRVAFSPDGKRLASVSEDLTVKVWDAQTGRELLSLTPKERRVGTGPAASVAFSPDGNRLAGLSGEPAVKVWDAQTGRELLSFRGWFSVVFSPDGKRLASLGGRVKVWDTQTGQELLSLKGSGPSVSVAFSPEGTRLATADEMGVKVWDAQTGQELLSVKANRGILSVVTFSADGHRLGRVSADGHVTIWDATPLPEEP